jgi:DMSO/TMAO reductase YedYZ molybdopterin-dependent catalytic subunit
MTIRSDRSFSSLLLDRRKLLRLAPVAALPLINDRLLSAVPTAAEDKPALIPREKDPVNLEFPFASLKSFLTPNDLFYVRNHFAVPELDIKTWRLQVVGAVKKPLQMTQAELFGMASSQKTITLECTGNGRAFLEPKAKGVPWQFGAVGTAEWTGVPLAALLEQTQIRSDAVEVVLEGADGGEVKNEPKPAGPIHFARGLPLAKAMKPEVLLAYKMNGEVLPAVHGFPLRAVVGGWYGMASVKWLTRIVVMDRPFHGYDQTTGYTIWERREGLPTLTPITVIEPKASIARPASGEKIAAGARYRVHGAAWAGETGVAKVDISTDGGNTWQTAKLIDKPAPLVWCRWEYIWETPKGGKVKLMARATDWQGRVQPLKRDPDRLNYMINHLIPVEVTVMN